MRVVDPGHLYELNTLDGVIDVKLQFVKRCGENYPGNSEPPYPGVTTQEVLRALIDRTKYVNGQHACEENEAALHCLRDALVEFERRAARVRGDTVVLRRALHSVTDLLNDQWGEVEKLPVCERCGHIACTKHLVQS